MEWRKLKNIILILLIGLNLALLLLIGGPKISGAYRYAQANRDAVAFLEAKGIRVSEGSIPRTSGMQAQWVERDRMAEEKAALTLLGEDSSRTAVGGEVYRYAGAAGTIQFHSDGAFWAQLEPGSLPTEEARGGAAQELLEQLGMTAQLLSQQERSVTLREQWEGYPLFSQQTTVTWGEDGGIEVAGVRRLYGVPAADPGRKTISPATALFHFYNGLNRMGGVCSSIDAIEPGYLTATSLNRLMSLTPVWRIRTDTGTYQLDLVSGGLERVSEG